MIAAGVAMLASGAAAGEVSPLAELSGDRIAACGLTIGEPAAGLTIRFALERTPGAAALFISATRADGQPVSGALAINIPGFETAAFQTIETERGPTLTLKGEETGFVIQRFMVAGAELRAGGAVIRVKGPLPQSVRAAYLNCAGDMYRQTP
ncbi:MAG: hypothetical protein NW215_14400 [Hyphomicrobiales bacterium]|nr:hypothetical protein [Hyphomicrobiales bacterium]